MIISDKIEEKTKTEHDVNTQIARQIYMLEAGANSDAYIKT
jgi:hypothetical protein